MSTRDKELPVLSPNPRRPSLRDEVGNTLSSGSTENSATAFPIDDRYVEFVLFGVVNGSFSRGPYVYPDENIEDGPNPMQDWAGPFQVSGGAITCQWVEDADSPSGHNLRFTVNAGATDDEAYMEQTVPIGGSRMRWTGNAIRAAVLRVAASDNGFRGFVDLSYLDAAGSVLDTSSQTASWTSDGVLKSIFAYGHHQSTSSPLAASTRLRVRIGVRRNTAADSATGTFDFSDIRNDRALGRTMIAEITTPGSYAAGGIVQSGGEVNIGPVGLTAAQLGITPLTATMLLMGNDGYFRVRVGHLRVDEISAPATPTSGQYAVYAKSSDSRLYGKNDAGTEVQLDSVDAPTTADYLVGTANAGLSAEIVVGTSPGGELGGTWAAPTVDATHSGSAHASFQPLDTDLTAIAALTSAADKLAYATGAGTWALTDLTATGRSILDDTSVGAVRTTLAAAPLASPSFTGTTTDANLLVTGTMPGLMFIPFSRTVALAGTGTNVMQPGDAAVAGGTPRITMPWAGSVVGLYIRSTTGWSAGTMVAKPNIDTAQQASPNVTLSTSNQFTGSATATRGVVTFTAGQSVGLDLVTSGWTPTGDTLVGGLWLIVNSVGA